MASRPQGEGKAKKRKSPFRIRCGSLVVTRNPVVPDHWISVWAEPPAAQRIDWTLVGCSVRCEVKDKEKNTRYLQGIVVKVIPGTLNTVELLLNDASKAHGLQRIDAVANPSELSKSDLLEKQIQGNDTAIVQIQLTGKWVLQTFVPPKKWETANVPVSGETKHKRKAKTMYIGDTNDTDAQQTTNWRYLAARFPRSWTIGQVLSVDTKAACGDTLAMVAIQPMLWPEQTKNGRQNYHGDNEVFVDADVVEDSKQYPIEALIQIAKKVISEETGAEDTVVAKLQYSRNANVYAPIGETIDAKLTQCHRCFVQGDQLRQCVKCQQHWWCKTCSPTEIDTLPCCNGECDCNQCQISRRLNVRLAWKAQLLQSDDPLIALKSLESPIDFVLPPDFLEPWPLPSSKPCTKLLLPSNRYSDYEAAGLKRQTKKRNRAESILEQEPVEDYTVFRSTCARTDAPKKKKYLRHVDPSMPEDRPRNARDAHTSRLLTETTPSSKQSKRALRWNQRRLEHLVGKTNSLASKEDFLRFGRSAIHAWGVFAEKAIEAEELLIEYRGELISNAVAERREVEYARSLGRDYMFRIDADQVCDATKQGNVARFINASCDPNCYTKIITFEGAKRIGIYAKRDIAEGEELSYDYKFETEYDPTKRIPCNCRAKDCRGFMNWDRRFVEVKIPNDITPDDSSVDRSFQGDGSENLSKRIHTSSAEYPTPTMLPPPPRQ